MREELMRRISLALDGEGLGSDAELQKELRSDPDAAKYAKDLTRLNMWLATWPLPEPDEAAFEAIASRIEQRMDEALPALADIAGPPMFEDDDALRDATVGLLESGEYRLGEMGGDASVDPSILSKPASPIARVLLEKKAPRGVVEESSGENSGEPLSAADLELRLSLDPKPRKKKQAAEPPTPPAAALAPGKVGSTRPPPMHAAPEPSVPEPAIAQAPSVPRAIPTLRVAGGALGGAEEARADASKAKRREPKSSPSNKVARSAAVVADLKPAKDDRPSGSWWAFAAAACVGLGVFGAATMFEGGGRAPGSPSAAATAASIVPTAAGPTESPTPMPVVAAPVVVAPTTPSEPSPEAVAQPVALDPAPMAFEQQDELLAAADRVDAPSHAARPSLVPSTASGSARGLGGSLYEGDVEARRRSASSPTTATTAPAPSRAARSPMADTDVAEPRPRPSPEPPSTVTPPTVTPTPSAPTPSTPSTTTPQAPGPPADDLPEVPDRATIQAVLQGVEAAVLACGNGEHGTADVDIVITGSGRVTIATVNGPFAGTPTGSCIARAVRGARFPAFAQTRFAVTYPFHL